MDREQMDLMIGTTSIRDKLTMICFLYHHCIALAVTTTILRIYFSSVMWQGSIIIISRVLIVDM